MLQSASSLAAALVVLLHLAFIAFAVLGAALLWRWPRVAWLHVPAVAWAAFVELANRTCPLTPFEGFLRRSSGASPYGDDFVGHYLLPLIYPAHLTRGIQLALGLGVALLNVVLYAAWLHSRRGRVAR
jgi:hypothetical protein